MGDWRLGVAAGALAVLSATGQAIAQPQGQSEPTDYFRRDRNTSVSDRQKQRSEDLGWRAGGFWIKPQLLLAAGYNDNIAASETNTEANTVYQAELEVDIESDWGRHELHGSIDVPSVNYTSDFAATDFLVNVGGRYDIDRGLSLVGGLNYGHRIEPYSNLPSGVQLREPIDYDEAGAYVGFTQVFNRLRFAGRADVFDTNFHDGEFTTGLPFEVDDRDVREISYGLRADYAVTELTSLFLSATANERDHDLDPPAVLLNKDTEGFEVLAGVNFDLTHLMRGEVGIGYFSQSFVTPGLEDQTGMAARGQVEWFPDELVTVTFGAERSVEDAFAPGARTLVANDYNVAVAYELRRNLILSLSTGYSFDDYGEIDRQDRRWNAFGGADYEINRNVSLTLSVGHQEQESEGLDLGRNYDVNVAYVGVRLRR